MAAVRFTTTPCEPYTAHRVQGKPYSFTVFAPVLIKLCMLGLKMLELFCKFLIGAFHALRMMVNVPVAIIFPSADCN